MTQDNTFTCELCETEQPEDQVSFYYRDIIACLTCVPEGYRDLEAEALAEREALDD